MKRVAIIGAGHNALVASCYLAAAGFSVSVFEASEKVGGMCINEEIFPGVTTSPIAMRYGMLRQRVIADLGLVRRGLRGFRAPYATTLLSNGDGVNFMLGTRDNNPCRFDVAGLTESQIASWNRLWSDAGAASRILSERQGDTDYTPEQFESDVRSAGGERLADHLFEGNLLDLANDYGLHPSLVAVVGNMCFCHPALPQSVMEFLYFGTSEAFSNLGEWGFVQGGMGRISELLADEAAARGVRIQVRTPIVSVAAESNGKLSVINGAGIADRFDIVLSCATPAATSQLASDGLVIGDSTTIPRSTVSSGLSHAVFHLLLEGLPDFPRVRELGRDSGKEYHGQIDLSLMEGELRSSLRRYQHDGEPFGEQVNICLNSLTALDSERAATDRHVLSGYHFFCPTSHRGELWNTKSEETLLEATYGVLERYIPKLRSHLVDSVIISPTTLAKRFGVVGYSCHHAPLRRENVLSNRRFGKSSAFRISTHPIYLCGAGGAPGPTVSGMPGYLCAHEIIAAHGPSVRMAK